ncbi:MAG: HAD-IIA family hydrolase [Anaerolineales bacterium]|nr:HAD-IIA family hydrolase [Anaerolineales bacterium]
MRLDEILCYLLDMDGTIYLGDQLLPGAREFFQLISERKIQYFLLTNNSSRSRSDYATKLRNMGLEVSADRILTSGEATASTLASRDGGARIYLVGTPSLQREFLDHGFDLSDEDPDTVVLGFDTTLTYDKLSRLCSLVRRGTPYIATHPDLNCPTAEGPIPDIGATIAFVEASTGRSPDEIIGKPFQPMLAVILSRTGLSPSQICMVGDRLYTDIAMGLHGLRTALVLSGETRPEDLAESPYKPDLVVSGIGELAQIIKDQE